MPLWSQAAADVAAIMAADGETVTIHTDCGATTVSAQWEEFSDAEGVQEGPALIIASNDLPSDLRQGNVVARTGYDDVWTIVNRQPSGVGHERLVLQKNH